MSKIKLLMVDNYDSFTFNIVQYFGELGAEVEVFRNDEITLDGIADCLPTVRDPLLRRRMELSRDANRRELTRLRAEYTATLQPGRRIVWDLA